MSPSCADLLSKLASSSSPARFFRNTNPLVADSVQRAMEQASEYRFSYPWVNNPLLTSYRGLGGLYLMHDMEGNQLSHNLMARPQPGIQPPDALDLCIQRFVKGMPGFIKAHVSSKYGVQLSAGAKAK